MSILDSLPCLLCRELEAPKNQFVDSSEPFLRSFRALYSVASPIPRKIEFDSAVYLQEGVLEPIYPHEDVTIIFIGDGNSDKRFSYNCHRLFQTFAGRYRIYCFICNHSLWGEPFGSTVVEAGWDGSTEADRLFFHAESWNQLPEMLNLIKAERKAKRQVLTLVDLDGTYFCPRPHYNKIIQKARKEAIADFCNMVFGDPNFEETLFDINNLKHTDRLSACYDQALDTPFSKAYEDEDLSMLITLGLYFEIISANDPLLNAGKYVGFTLPKELLTYASFFIKYLENNKLRNDLERLNFVYSNCKEAILSGAPTAFLAFREKEEQKLRQMAKDNKVVLSRPVAQYILDAAKAGAVPIAYSDRPNASMGLESNSDSLHTSSPKPDSIITTKLLLTPGG